MKKLSTTRRTFLRRSLATGAAVAAGPLIGRAAGANDIPGVLAIGVRGRGGAVAAGAARLGRIVSVCDVDTECSAGFLARLKKGIQDQVPGTCGDYRKALERKDVDIVTIGTPDHWHAKMIIDALDAGKDVYVEKPMTLTIEEGRIVCDAVRNSGRVVQVGTQQRSEYDGIFLKAVAIAQAGWLGKNLRATVFLPPAYGKDSGPYPVTEAPANLDWDRWLGPVPKLPYCKQRCHGGWRNWIETGHGPLTDWGVHHVDIAQWALEAQNTGPLKISGKGIFPQGREQTLAVLLGEKPSSSLPNGKTTVTNYRAELAFASGRTLRIESQAERPKLARHSIGLLLEGDEHQLWVSRQGQEFVIAGPIMSELQADPARQLILTEKVAALCNDRRPEWSGPGEKMGDIVPTSHMANFFSCVRSREQPISDVFTHHRANTTCILANMSMLLDRPLEWNPDRQEFVADPQANALRSRKQRAPYHIRA